MIAWGYSLAIDRKADFALGKKGDPEVIPLTEGGVILLDDYDLTAFLGTYSEPC